MRHNLSALIAEYKQRPTENLKNAILELLLTIKNPESIDRQLCFTTDDWILFGKNLRIKRSAGRTFFATETFEGAQKYIGFCYRIFLDDYTFQEIDAYEKNCMDFAEKAPDDDYFAAASIAATLDEQAAVDRIVVDSKSQLDAWLESIEKETV